MMSMKFSHIVILYININDTDYRCITSLTEERKTLENMKIYYHI